MPELRARPRSTIRAGEQRVAAEVEEVVARRRCLRRRAAPPRSPPPARSSGSRGAYVRSRSALLGEILRMPAARGGRPCRSAVSGSAGSTTNAGRHHVLGQRAAQVAPERRRVAGTRPAPGRRRRPGAASSAGGAAQHDDGFRDLRQARERRLDLAQLDAEAADLDLVVDAAEELDRAVAAVAHAVAGAVEPRAGHRRRTDRGTKRSAVSSGAVEVAARDAGAADVELARHADGHRLAMSVEHVDLACWRSAGRSAPSSRRSRHVAHLVPGRERRRLGRPVDVEQPRGAAVRAAPRRPSAARPPRRRTARAAGRGTRPAHRAATWLNSAVVRNSVVTPLARRSPRRSARGDERDVARHDDQPRAVEQRAPDLEGRGVERRIRDLRDDVVRSPSCT